MKEYVIGRDTTCDIVINDSAQVISRHHATLQVTSTGKMTITDNSQNGTYVNGIRITPKTPYPVRRGDNVMFAKQYKLNWSLIADPVWYLKYVSIAAVAAVVIVVGLVAYMNKGSRGSGGYGGGSNATSDSIVYNSNPGVVINNVDTAADNSKTPAADDKKATAEEDTTKTAGPVPGHGDNDTITIAPATPATAKPAKPASVITPASLIQ